MKYCKYYADKELWNPFIENMIRTNMSGVDIVTENSWDNLLTTKAMFRRMNKR